MIAKLSLRAGAGIVERGGSWPYQETIRRSNKTHKKNRNCQPAECAQGDRF